VSDGHSSVLFTGDIVRLSEYLLIKAEPDVSADIVIVPHHGSATSSSAAFIGRIAPDLGVASLARGNQWRMPDPAVVQRYVKRGIRWLDTGRAGQVSLIFNQQGWRAETRRNNQSNAWYRQMLRKGVE
jgi:competence protein ComEC